MSDKTVTIEIGRDGCCAEGTGYQVFIDTTGDGGIGRGYRIFGPKPCAVGRQATVKSHTLTQRDARQIFGHIRPLLGEEWLRERIEENNRG